MARSGGYIILAKYDSSSSDKVYEVRRGGDGVLYCTCRGWVASKERPRACSHCKDYVVKHPGTLYGPAQLLAAMTTVTPVEAAPTPSKKPVVIPQIGSLAQATADWRKTLLVEKHEAAKRVATPESALRDYSRELDLDDHEAIVPVVAVGRHLDI